MCKFKLKNFKNSFFSSSRLYKTETNYHETIVVKVHPEDPKWMEVHMPITLYCGKNQRFFDGTL
jgi:hypothetical protein